MSDPFIIIGAGPGGLTAAAALRRVGLSVLVLERAPTLRTAGAGLTLQVNAMRMLHAVDLARPIAAAGEALLGGSIATSDGAPLANVRFADAPGGIDRGVAIHRGELARILADAVPEDCLRFQAEVTGTEQAGSTVRVVLRDGSEIAGQAAIAADGIHSATRTFVFGRQPLRYAGYTCWRGIANLARPLGAGVSSERWGAGRRFGIVPIDAHRTYWFATANAPADGSDGPDPRAELLERFADFASPVPELLHATDNASILRNDIFDLAPVRSWTKGRITLLGDAAHAMTPNLGQGACQAIEDAVTLAHYAARSPVEEALTAYEAARRNRAQAFVEQSRNLGRLAQWENRVGRALRDTLVRLTPQTVVSRNMSRAWDVEVPCLELEPKTTGSSARPI